MDDKKNGTEQVGGVPVSPAEIIEEPLGSAVTSLFASTSETERLDRLPAKPAHARLLR